MKRPGASQADWTENAIEASAQAIQERSILFYDHFLVSCSACLLVFLVGLGYAEIAQGVSLEAVDLRRISIHDTYQHDPESNKYFL